GGSREAEGRGTGAGEPIFVSMRTAPRGCQAARAGRGAPGSEDCTRGVIPTTPKGFRTPPVESLWADPSKAPDGVFGTRGIRRLLPKGLDEQRRCSCDSPLDQRVVGKRPASGPGAGCNRVQPVTAGSDVKPNTGAAMRPKRGVPEGLWLRCPQCKAT